MTLSSSTALVEALRAHGLLAGEQLEVVAQLATTIRDAQSLARELIGWITDYQAGELLKGRGEGLVVGSYRVLEPVGKGGMGQVFRARHTGLDRVVALKLILPQRLESQKAVERFRREAQAVTLLSHPHIVAIHDVGQAGETFYLAMEFLQGSNLAEYLEKHGPLPVGEACEYIRQAALGLQHAHEKGLVHRDVKPANLMRTDKGQIKVLDLGLALVSSATTLTQHSGAFLGTVDYIAPEQVTDPHGVDIRADIYSLGCTLYHLLAGRVPFADVHPVARAGLRLSHDPQPIKKLCPDVPGKLVAVLGRMMARQPQSRYSTPREVAEALDPFVRAERAPQPGDTIAGWLLEELLTTGSKCALFQATKAGWTAGLYVLPPGLSSEPAWVEWFQSRLRALAGLKREDLPAIFGFGPASEWGRCYVVVELSTGISLEQYHQRKGALSLSAARKLFVAVADALAAVHEQGLVHGRIHPANIILRKDMPPLLVGFDLTGDSKDLGLLGGPVENAALFASPEQVQEGETLARSDVYSLARCLYRSLLNKEEKSDPELFYPGLVPGEVRVLLARALDRDPMRRPDAADFRDRLQATAGRPHVEESKQEEQVEDGPDTSEWLARAILGCMICIPVTIVLTLLAQLGSRGPTGVRFLGVCGILFLGSLGAILWVFHGIQMFLLRAEIDRKAGPESSARLARGILSCVICAPGAVVLASIVVAETISQFRGVTVRELLFLAIPSLCLGAVWCVFYRSQAFLPRLEIDRKADPLSPDDRKALASAARWLRVTGLIGLSESIAWGVLFCFLLSEATAMNSWDILIFLLVIVADVVYFLLCLLLSNNGVKVLTSHRSFTVAQWWAVLAFVASVLAVLSALPGFLLMFFSPNGRERLMGFFLLSLPLLLAAHFLTAGIKTRRVLNRPTMQKAFSR